MAKLTEPQKDFIVQRLAVYDTPTMVVEAVQDRFGISVSRQQVDGYNPTHEAAGRPPRSIAERLRKLFDATRAAFNDTIDHIPIAQRSYRLARLGAMFEKTYAKGNYPLAAALAKQAAEEAGGIFSNKREVKHSGSIATTPDDLTTEDKRAALIPHVGDALAAAIVRHAGGTTTH